ncbi:MAG: hypothetical protein AMJ69_11770 [Gammaproteobacteria bacterium SG8_47]|nr:MAG: hypothetical protein AMJ69_11770 [Gammaproteobacteria bacterium SG8_47]
MPSDKTRSILIPSFAAVLGLMILLTAIGVTIIHSNYQRLETVVNSHNVKFDLITRMRTAARERTVSLQKMLTLEDPFARDEEWMRFNGYGGEFAAARAALLSRDLTEQEQRLLMQQGEMVALVGPLQVQIAEQILTGQTDSAHKMLVEKAIPAQDKTFTILSTLLEMQQQAAERSVSSAHTYHDGARVAMIGLAVLVMLLTFGIATYVISRTTQTERRLAAEKERAQVTLHAIGDAVITTDAHGRVEQMNAAAASLVGRSSEAVRELKIDQVLPLQAEQGYFSGSHPLLAALEHRRVIVSDGGASWVDHNGEGRALEYTAAPIIDNDGGLIGATLVFRDVTQMRALSEQLAYRASHDELTGLKNRREFEAALEQALAEVRRYSEEQHWLCYVDLDQFKVINDTCGHIAGDELLKQIAAELTRQVRASDTVARLGGDEFALLLRKCKAAEARSLVERLRSGLNKLRFCWDNKCFSNTASIGLVPILETSGSAYDLLGSADTACYIAKEEGRNRVHISESVDDVAVQRRGEMQFVHRIEHALDENRFMLFFQEIRALQSPNSALHGEVLVRMLDEKGNIIPPMAFLPAAERYNMMTKIDRWVLENALRTVEKCGDRELAQRCMLSVNLSAHSLCNDDFLAFVLGLFDESTVRPEQICFEVTETSAIANLSRAVEFITTLKERGCRFALDDFGSGLSSFGYLKNLPVDYLKIDGSFVRDMLDDPMDQALVEAVNHIGHVLGISTIAEYVENAQLMASLQRIGVDYAQGYGVARPVPLHHVISAKPGELASSA